MSTASRRWLIIKTSSLGDIIHTIPFLCSLHHGMGVKIHWVLEEKYKELLVGHPYLECIISFEKNILGLLRTKDSLQDYEVAIDLQGLLKSALILFLVKSKRKIFFYTRGEASWLPFFERIKAPSHLHAVKRYLSLTDLFGIEKREEFVLPPTPSQDLWAEELLYKHRIKRPIGLCLQSRWMTKSVKIEDANRIVARLLREGYYPLLFGMDGVFEQEERILHVQGVGLKKIVSLMKKCTLFLGVDTGLLHLAAALGVCTIALFGPTSPSLTGPYGEGHKVLKKSLPCSPCFKRVCAKRECMRFDEEEILSAIRECR